MRPIQTDNGTILNNGPWGAPSNRPQPPGPGAPGPDLDNLIRQAHGRFKNSFGRGGSDGRPSRKGEEIGAIFAVLLGLWLASGLYRVETSENAVVLTFGQWTYTKTDPGLGYHLPWPIQAEQKVDVKLDRRVSVGFRDENTDRSGTASRSGNNINDVPFESAMLTGDQNIINIDFVVLWHVGDAKNYLFSVRDPETTIKKVAESAMREIIGRTPIQGALTGARNDIETQTRDLMQKVLDEYKTGAIVTSVQLQKVDPPGPVVDAFDDVQRARSDQERAKNEAETYANDIVPRARGDVQKLLQDAAAYKEAVTAKAEGDAQRFLSVYAAYQQSKDVTERRMYLETMQGILQNSKKIISDNGSGTIMPYLPFDPPKAEPAPMTAPAPSAKAVKQ